MVTVSELRARRDAQICYLLAIEGLPYLWTTDAEIAGGGPGSWIGQDDTSRTVLAGLQMPNGVAVQSDTQTGNLDKAGSVNFRLLDVGGEVADLFAFDASGVETVAGPQVMPDDDPAPPTVFNGAIFTPTSNKHIGSEAIGPANERRWWPLFPDQVLPGDDHFAVPLDYAEGTPVGISEKPYAFEGLRVALWRLFKDVDGGLAGAAAWPRWSLQHAGGALVWWGKLLPGISANGRVWRLPCTGPEAFLAKTLNRNSTAQWLRVASTLRLAEGERDIWVDFRKWEFTELNQVQCGRSFANPVHQFTETPNLAELESKIIAAIDEAKAAVPGDSGNAKWDPHAYTDSQTPNFGLGFCPKGEADFEPERFRIRILVPDEGSFIGWVDLIVHEKVLLAMGFDPYQQGRPTFDDVEAPGLYEANPVVEPLQYFLALPNDFEFVDPGASGYWRLRFVTKKPIPGFWSQMNALEIANDGNFRDYSRFSPPGVQIPAEGGVEADLTAQEPDPVYVEGFLGRPIAGDATFTVDRTRYFALRGPYARFVQGDNGEQSIEVEQRTMVCKCSWANAEGQIALGVGLYRRLWLEFFNGQPRAWGIDSEPVAADGYWAAVSPFVADEDQKVFRLTPLAPWVYTGVDGFERTGALLSRLLLSTGTASWPPAATEGDPGAGPNQGVNSPPDAGVYGDLEIADLGLQIPYQIVDVDSFKAIDQAMDPALRDVKLARHGPIQARDVINDLLGAGGWSIGLRGKKYTAYRLWEDPDPDDVDAIIDLSSYHNERAPVGKGYATMERAPIWPIDKIEVEYFKSPFGDAQGRKEVRARDLLSRVRPGVRSRTVRAAFLTSDPTSDEEPWEAAFKALWQNQIARYHSRPYRLLRGVRLPRQVGQDLYPGSVVRVTNPWPANADGTYGWFDHLGRVIKVFHATKVAPLDCTTTVDILVGPKALGDTRFFAPIARVVDDVATSEERYNPGTFTFKCYKDAFDTGSSISDVKGFAEPAWSSTGGDALIWGYQYDGVSWAQTFSGTVASVDETTDTIALTGAITGTFFERMYTVLVLAPHDTPGQAPWVQALYLVNTRPDGTFGGGPTDGYKLET